MKEFPNMINVKNKNNFDKLHYNRTLCYLRRNLYEHIIKEPENNYFDISSFNKKYNNDTKSTEKMIKVVIKELNNLGWKTKISYGGTGLFIYSSENPPPNCWDDTW